MKPPFFDFTIPRSEVVRQNPAKDDAELIEELQVHRRQVARF
jgi:hypothetical protein